MRTLKLLPLIFLFLSCHKEDAVNEEPLTGTRPATTTGATSSPSDSIESDLKTLIFADISYFNFFHHFSIKSTAEVDMPGHIIDYGVKHMDKTYSIGSEQIAAYSSDYSGDTLLVNIDIPFWHYYRFDFSTIGKFFNCEDAYEATDSQTLSAYESEVFNLYKPVPIARIDSALIIDLSTTAVTGEYF